MLARRLSSLAVLAALALPAAPQSPPPGWTLLAWNDLGMHCMDSDFSVFMILPPYNNLHAQLIDPTGQLVTDPQGLTLTYQATAAPDGSRNATSVGKTDWWDHAGELLGVALAPDEGLAGHDMPGALNTPQPMAHDPALAGWKAEGIPITPRDDAGRQRSYPLLRVEARDGSGKLLASAVTVVPVSDEMDCTACHASGAGAAAQPAGGWVQQADADRDLRLNILRLHDELQASDPDFLSALATAGYSAAGLEATVTGEGQPILCASCHASNALGTPGIGSVKPLTAAMHGKHATVTDPESGLQLEDVANRSACYRCHPGSTTRCLRGAMGSAVAADGGLAIQCQSCHGSMSAVGSVARDGWLDEPNCQACHTGTATHNNGQIRYTDALEDGALRVAVDGTFATDPNTPAFGYSLYKLSFGHGGLRCQACHGSTHAEYPGLHPNDNLQAEATQGHLGAIAECNACHPGQPKTVAGGPHGLHPIGPVWVERHPEAAEGSGDGADDGAAGCQGCHGSGYLGTVLSATQADRTLNGKPFLRGSIISCWTCHAGPDGEGGTGNARPSVSPVTVAAAAGQQVEFTLPGSDPNGDPLTWRVLRQPGHGRVALDGAQATYLPDAGFAGDDTFSFTARDAYLDAAGATGRVTRAGEWSPLQGGLAGSGGQVPQLAVDGDLVPGGQLQVDLGNPSAAPGSAWLFASPDVDRRATQAGGWLFVGPGPVLSLPLPADGGSYALRLPPDPAGIGSSLVLQALVADAGAPHGWAFTPAVRIVTGP